MAASVPSTLRGALEPWCAVGATGALRVEDPPGGAIYIVDGRLTYAECGLVSGVDKLLTASGRVPADVWRAAVASGRATGRIGDTLIADGHIGRNGLALSALSALMDAAFFLFDAAVTARFEPDVVNPLGAFCELEFAAVCAEVDRRRQQLDDIWPDPAIDTAAVVPARRMRGHQVSLTAAQWEIVANADRRRSPADLARLLGRETFVMLLEARRLARSGLIEPGRPGGSAVAESVAAVRARTAAATVRAADPRSPDRQTHDRQHRDRPVQDHGARDPRAADPPGAERRVPEQRVEARSPAPARASAVVSAVVPGAEPAAEPAAVPAAVPTAPAPIAAPVAAPVAPVVVPTSVPALTLPVPAQAAGEQGRRDQPGPVPLPRRRAAGPRRWPANPADDGRVVEECSESTLVRIQRALRALR